MNPVEWRKLQEATADLAKALATYYKHLKKDGFSRWQAMDLVKIFFIQSIAGKIVKRNQDE